MKVAVPTYVRRHRILETAIYRRIYMIYMTYQVVIAVLPFLLLGVAGIANQALAWGDSGEWGQGGSEYYQNSCGYNCRTGEGDYHSYRYLVGFQDGVQDAQAGNAYDCQIGYQTINYCNGYSAGFYSVNSNQEPEQQQNQESQSSSTSTSYSQSNPHTTIYNVLPSDQGQGYNI